MSLLATLQQIPTTPAMVFEQQAIVRNAEILAELAHHSGCKPLYSIKALPLSSVLQWVKPYLEGFAVSSLFEARLADEVLHGSGSIHLTSPGIRADEIAALQDLCTHISFNSRSQWQRLQAQATSASCGLRINPQLSFAADRRYDPCGPYSKLGVNLQELWLQGLDTGIQGLHVHTMFAATDFAPLLTTVQLLRQTLGSALQQLQWLNLGGGYLFGAIQDHRPFIELVQRLRGEYGVEVYIEPGKAVVGNAGYLVASVIDLFSSDGKTIAVLDSSVNHLPEVFEYQRPPQLLGQVEQGQHRAVLVGSTCLAGDVFGEYSFAQPLALGSRVVFQQVGAYSLIKANRFNGYQLPALYALQEGHSLQLLKEDTYAAYREQWWL